MKIGYAKNQQGSALMITLITTAILTLAMGSYLLLVSGQFKATARSQEWNAAIPIAEAGIEEAMAHLNLNFVTNPINPVVRVTNALPWSWSDDGTTTQMRRTNSDGSYYVVSMVMTNLLKPVITSQGWAVHYAHNSPGVMFATAGATVPTKYLPRKLKVTTRIVPVFDHALAADGMIEFKGIVETDSFNSHDPTASTDGQYDPSKRRDNGDVATNLTIEDSMDIGNAKIRGHVSTGPDGSIEIGPNGSVGDSSHVAGNTGIQDGAFSDDMNVDFEPVDVPFTDGVTPTGDTVTNLVLTTNITVISTCDCTGYSTIPCCTPSGTNGIVSDVITATTSTTYPASGSYLGGIVTNWTDFSNQNGMPTGIYTNLTYNTKSVKSQTVPTTGSYIPPLATEIKGGKTWYIYNEIQSYNYSAPVSFTFALLSGQKRTSNVVTTNFVTETYDYVLENGHYQLSTLGGKVLVEGHAELYVTGNISFSGQGGIWIRPGASLKIYCAGADASFGGQGIANEGGLAENFSYYGLPSNTSVSMHGNATFIGTIYAPNADLTLGGGGSGDEDFIGAAITKTVKMNGHFKFHYDEALADWGPQRGFRVTSWTEEAPE